jgi:serine protease Do
MAVLLVALVATGTGFFGFNVVQRAQFAQAADQVEATRQQLAKADDLASVFRYVGKVVEPSVVNIQVTKTSKASLGGGGRFRRLPMDPEQLRKFLPDRDGDGEPDLPDFDMPDEMPFEQHGTGSGVIMEVTDGVGYILTNNHVAGDATGLEITLNDGRKITKAQVLGADKKTDLAVVKIHADRLIPAKWGNSDELQKGDWVMAFGSPFGYVGSMTHGIVSALNRYAGILGQQGYESFIQVDAPINPGNSGGPLVNTRGEVVGINTAIASRTGSFSGIGFAIPANQAKFVFDSLKSKGKVTRGWLGVSIQSVSEDLPLAESFGYKGQHGVLVRQVVPNTPATGKLHEGDIITTLNGKSVETVQELRNAIAATSPNSKVNLNVFRDGKELQVELTLGEQPDNLLAGGPGKSAPGSKGGEGAETGVDKLGMKLADPSQELLRKWDLGEIKTGAVVTAVTPRGLAAREGVRPGDVITKVGNQEVKNAQEATDALAKADLKKGVRLYVSSKDPESGQILSRFVLARVDE